MYWKVIAKDAAEYELWPLHLLPSTVDREIGRLLAEVPGTIWNAEIAREQDIAAHAVIQHRPRESSLGSLTLVLVRDGSVLGVYRAYESTGCLVRTKSDDGAGLMRIGRYMNVGPSACNASIRASGIYTQVYDIRLRLIQALVQRVPANQRVWLLAGVLGSLSQELSALYVRYPKDCPFIPRHAFEERVWERLGIARPESRSAELLALRHGFCKVGFKKSDGGPLMLRMPDGGPIDRRIR